MDARLKLKELRKAPTRMEPAANLTSHGTTYEFVERFGLVNSVNENETVSLLTSYGRLYALKDCSGPHAAATLMSIQRYIALGRQARKSLKFQRDGIRSLQLLDLNDEFLVSAESYLRVDYRPCPLYTPPSLLPNEWSGEVLGSRRRGRYAACDVARIPLKHYHIEEKEKS
ncbi:hypothetical protein Tco_1227230 [Tanacetum coccineum]